MEFKNDDCTFTIPDRPTVRQQLAWFSAVSGHDQNDLMERYWDGAKALIQKWECAALPDYKVDIDTIDKPTQTAVMIWAGMQVLNFMRALEDVPKNA